VPVVAKADTLTVHELATLKATIRQGLQDAGIQVFWPGVDGTGTVERTGGDVALAGGKRDVTGVTGTSHTAQHLDAAATGAYGAAVGTPVVGVDGTAAVVEGDGVVPVDSKLAAAIPFARCAF
jgi:hypothetical protein